MSKIRLTKPVWIALSVAGVVCITLLLGLALSFIVGERSGNGRVQAGVTLSGGVVTVVACSGRGIEKVDIQRGKDVDGPLVWSASAVGTSADWLPVRQHVEGYSIDAVALPLQGDTIYSIRAAYDSDGRSLINSYVEFQPDELTPGIVTTVDGNRLAIEEYKAHSKGCV